MIQALPPFTTQETTMQKRDHDEHEMTYLDLLKKAQDQAPNAESAAAIQKLIEQAGAVSTQDSGGGGHTDPDHK